MKQNLRISKWLLHTHEIIGLPHWCFEFWYDFICNLILTLTLEHVAMFSFLFFFFHYAPKLELFKISMK